MPIRSNPGFFATAVLALLPSIASSADACFGPATARVEVSRRTVDQDDAGEMNRWYKQAFDANHAGVIRRVARINFARQDYEAAFRAYSKAAYLGDFESMYDVGLMWFKGEGREADASKAYAWYRLAGERIPADRDEIAFPPKMVAWYQSLAGDLAKQLTPEQVEAGDRYYDEQKKLVVCDWYAWYAESRKGARKNP